MYCREQINSSVQGAGNKAPQEPGDKVTSDVDTRFPQDLRGQDSCLHQGTEREGECGRECRPNDARSGRNENRVW